MIDQKDRDKFVEKMLLELELNNYGFKFNPNLKTINYKELDIELQKIKEFRAIKELFIRLNVWKMCGRKDKGTINYVEANRKIVYDFDDKDIAKCSLVILR